MQRIAENQKIVGKEALQGTTETKKIFYQEQEAVVQEKEQSGQKRFWAFERSQQISSLQQETGCSCLHGVTLRSGGYSNAPYDGCNMALHVGDRNEAVLANRGLVTDYLGIPAAELTCADQIHGLQAVRITAELAGAGATDQAKAIPGCDAMYTNERGIAMVICIADCVPVLLYDAKRQAAAVIHAGWRGAIGELPVLTLRHMTEDFGTEPGDCYAYLGPSIGPASFEVSPELAERFGKACPEEDVVTWLLRPGASEKTPHVDLWTFISRSLQRAGIPAEHITITERDSMTTADCFSYRRDAGHTGRMALFAMLDGANK